MKRRDIKSCSGCGRSVAHSNGIEFYTLEIDRHLLNYDGIREIHGLETMLGQASPLADVLGTDTDIAEPFPDSRLSIWLCGECFYATQACHWYFSEMERTDQTAEA